MSAGTLVRLRALCAMLHLQPGPRLVPLTCHMIGNAYAAWERLAG